MKEKYNNISNIRERLLQFIEHQQLDRDSFLEKIGTTKHSFKGSAVNSTLKSDIIEKFIGSYKDIVNPYWFLLGEGKMLLKDMEGQKTPLEKYAPLEIIAHIRKNKPVFFEHEVFQELVIVYSQNKKLDEMAKEMEKLKMEMDRLSGREEQS